MPLPRDGDGGGTIRELLAVQDYPYLLAAGLVFDWARIGMGFLGPWYMNDATHSPRLVQLTGSASWIFLIAGPCFGVISDRFDRRRTVVCVLGAMAVMSAGIAWLLQHSLMSPSWMFVYMVLSSVCTVLDTTNRPALIYDLLFLQGGERFVGLAMALRSIGSNSGKIFGNQAVGYLVEHVGVGAAFLVVAALLGTACLLVSCVPSPPKAKKRSAGGGSGGGGRDGRGGGGAGCEHEGAHEGGDGDEDGGEDGDEDGGGVIGELRAGVAMAWGDKAFMSMLGVTFLANFNYWSHMPLLQVLATRLDASPYQTGLLLSASGWGGLVASLLVTSTNPVRIGLVYCLGITFADLILPGAAILNFKAAFSALAGSGFLAGLFGAVQSALVMGMVPDELRGRALGMLTMAIGAGPFGMAVLGELAERYGAPAALLWFALAGFAAQLVWLFYRPEALWIKRPTSTRS